MRMSITLNKVFLAIGLVLSLILSGLGVHFCFIKLNEKSDQIKDLGSFEYEGTKTQIVRTGNCKVFMTKWKSDENVRLFFDCAK